TPAGPLTSRSPARRDVGLCFLSTLKGEEHHECGTGWNVRWRRLVQPPGALRHVSGLRLRHPLHHPGGGADRLWRLYQRIPGILTRTGWEGTIMRALCGAIITAGSLIGLGLAAIGIGTRYADFFRTATYENGQVPEYMKFWQMDTPLIVIVVALLCTMLVGLGLAVVGLAYHHERRHREYLHDLAGRRELDGPRVSVG